MALHFDNETFIETSGILFEESMQPEIIIQEFHANVYNKINSDPRFAMLLQGTGAGQPQGQQQQPSQMLTGGQQQAPPGQGAPPQGTNVVPFPGGQQQQPQMGQPQPGEQQQIMQMLQQQLQEVDPEDLIQGQIKKAIALIRKDLHRNYRIDIEVDSTIYSDEMQERQDAVEFTAALGKVMGEAAQLGQQIPEAIPLLAKSIQFLFKKFRVGRELESTLDIFVEDMVKKSKELIANPPPSPETQKIQAEMQKDKQQFQMQSQNDQNLAKVEVQRAQQEAQIKTQQGQADLQFKQQENQMKMQVEAMKLEIEKMKAQIEAQALQQKVQADGVMHQQNMQAAEQQHQHTMTEGALQHQEAQQSHSQEMTSMHEQAKVDDKSHQQTMEHSTAQHKQKMAATKMKPKSAA